MELSTLIKRISSFLDKNPLNLMIKSLKKPSIMIPKRKLSKIMKKTRKKQKAWAISCPRSSKNLEWSSILIDQKQNIQQKSDDQSVLFMLSSRLYKSQVKNLIVQFYNCSLIQRESFFQNIIFVECEQQMETNPLISSTAPIIYCYNNSQAYSSYLT